jgi:hypothetical protein
VATGAGQRCEPSLHELYQRFVLSLRGIAQLQVDAHVRTVELHLAHGFAETRSRPVLGSIRACSLAWTSASAVDIECAAKEMR